MATTKMSKAASAKSLKKSVTKAPAKAAARPQPKKLSTTKAPPSKKAPPKPVRTVSKAATKKPAAVAAKPKNVKAAASNLAAAKKDLNKKPVKTAPVTAQKLAHKPISKSAAKPEVKPTAAAEPKKPRLIKADLDHFKGALLAMRDRITGQSGSMRNAALQRNDEINPEEDGTDAFMRLQTLEQVSSQQQIVTNIDEALRAIEKGTYGVCDNCGELINKPRLSVLPFAKNCIKCQSEMERPHRPGGRR